jgi:predicted transcriptional regulator
MSHDPLALHEAKCIGQAVVSMQSQAVRWAPLTSKGGSLVGIVSVDDLLDSLAEQLDDIARLIKRQIRGPQSSDELKNALWPVHYMSNPQ